MAILKSGDLSLEIKYNSVEPDWIVYEVKFAWKDEVIINDAILKRYGNYWGRRPPGTFLANDYESDHLIDMLKRVLETNEPDYWQPVEPDITMAIYPGKPFPFGMKDRWEFVDEEGREFYEEMKKIESECITIITLVDTYNLEGLNHAYSGNGLSLHLQVKKESLEKFVLELEAEYKGLKIEHTDLGLSSVEHVAGKIDALSLDPAIAELVLFLKKEGPKKESEIVAGLPGFDPRTFGKAGELLLIEHHDHLVWLTHSWGSLATVLDRLQRSL